MTVAIITNTTEQTLNTIESFKTTRMPPSQAQKEVSDLLEEAIVDIENNPCQYPLDVYAQSRGIMLRRWIDRAGKYICLFHYNPTTDTAILDIFASTRQDYLNLLYLIQISRP